MAIADARAILANLRSLRALWVILIATLAAAGLFAAIIYVSVDRWRLMPATPARVIEIEHFIASLPPSKADHSILLLGSSVLGAGGDATVIDDCLPAEYEAYNLSWTGADARQWLLCLPAIRAADPALVVVVLDLASASRVRGIPPDLVAIARWWRFWDDSDAQAYAGIIRPSAVRAFERPRWLALWDMRVFLPGFVDGYFREVSRPSLRYEGYTTNFKAPWIRRSTVSPAAMQFQLALWQADMESVTTEQRLQAATVLETLLVELAATPTRAALVFAPVHPKLRERLGPDFFAAARAELTRLSLEHGVPLLDHGDQLPAEMFADPVHPFVEGRAQWSARLGRELATLVAGS